MSLCRDPMNINCPVCSAKAGEPCRVRKQAGTYSRRSTRHYQVVGAPAPIHERRIEAARDATVHVPALPGPRRGRAERLAILKRLTAPGG